MMVDRIDVPEMGRSVSLQWVFPAVWHCWWDRIDVPGWVKCKLAGCSLESGTVGGIDVVESEFEKIIA